MKNKFIASLKLWFDKLFNLSDNDLIKNMSDNNKTIMYDLKSVQAGLKEMIRLYNCMIRSDIESIKILIYRVENYKLSNAEVSSIEVVVKSLENSIDVNTHVLIALQSSFNSINLVKNEVKENKDSLDKILENVNRTILKRV